MNPIKLIVGILALLASGSLAAQERFLIDWDEVRTDQRREGSYFAVWGFATKLGAVPA